MMTVLDLPPMFDIDDVLDRDISLREYLARCVERGAAALDHVRHGWRNEIAIEVFDIRKSCNCVMGQLLDLDPTRPVIDVVHEAEHDPLVLALTAATGADTTRVYASELGFDYDEYLEDAASERGEYESYDLGMQFKILQGLWLAELTKTEET